MDDNGIATSVLSLAAPSLVGWHDQERCEMARRVNEYVASLASTNPGLVLGILSGAGGPRTCDQRITKPTILTATVLAGNYLCRTVFDCLQALVTSQQLVANPDHCR